MLIVKISTLSVTVHVSSHATMHASCEYIKDLFSITPFPSLCRSLELCVHRVTKHNAIIDIDMSEPDIDMPDADADSDSEWTAIPDFDQTLNPDQTDPSDLFRYERAPKELGSLYVARRPTIPLKRISKTLFDQGCTICLTAFDLKEPTRDVIQMGCDFGHCFDRGCINQWLSEEGSNQNTCPMCRYEFFEMEDETEEEEEEEDEKRKKTLSLTQRMTGTGQEMTMAACNGLQTLSISETFKQTFSCIHSSTRKAFSA